MLPGLCAVKKRRSPPFVRCILILVAAIAPGLAALPLAAQSSSPSFEQLSAAASAARRRGDLPHAASLYQQALALNPSWPDGWWYLGQLLYGADDYAQAADAFTHYLTLVPNAGPATALRGLCEFSLGEYPSSLTDIQHALALGAADDSRNAQILRYHEGMLLTRLGRFEEALAAYGYFARQHISSDEMLLALGLAVLRQPLLPASAAPAQRDLLLAAGKAAWLLQSGDPDAAAQAFSQIFRSYPSAANVHYTWGYLLYPTDQDAAIAEFQRELAIDPANSTDETMLAWALLMENEPAQALPHARKAAEEASKLPMARLSLGRALLETGDVKSALPVLESVLALDPQNLEIHIALARAYSESGRAQDARRERLTCLRMTAPAQPNAAGPTGEEAAPAK